VALAAGSWGTWALVIRHVDAMAPMPAALESTIVMAVITAVAGVASLRDPASAQRSWGAWASIAWFGVADIFNVLLFFAAYKLTIAVAVLTHYLTPILVALLAPLVLRERMTARTGCAIAVSFLGLAVMIAPSGTAASATTVWASAALGAGSAVFYASNVLVNKWVAGSFSTSQAMFWHGVVATVVGAAVVPPSAWARIDPGAVAFLSVAAIGPGALGGLAFVWGLRRMPAAHASTLTLLEPLVSLILGAAVLGEHVGGLAILGGSMILGGAVLVMTQARETTVKGRHVGRVVNSEPHVE
jgi:drug/metabolite transporter (DMT)-like permease